VFWEFTRTATVRFRLWAELMATAANRYPEARRSLD
jgi:hypothetical protein